MGGLDDLKIYQLSADLEMEVHEITKQFPVEEKYRSVDQVRRSASSTRSNIAEGYTRYAYGDKIHQLHIARAEAEETKRHLEMARKKNFANADKVNRIIDGYTDLHKGINGYVRFLRKQSVINKLIPKPLST